MRARLARLGAVADEPFAPNYMLIGIGMWLAIIMAIFRTRRSASVDDANLLKY